jgi:hypothetical protein
MMHDRMAIIAQRQVVEADRGRTHDRIAQTTAPHSSATINPANARRFPTES